MFVILFAQMISLTQIMAEVMDTFYTQVAIQDFANAGKKSTDLIIARAKPVQIKLRQWHERLPAVVRMNAPTKSNLSSLGTPAQPSSTWIPSADNHAPGYLHLAYFATEITLHRRIVQSLDNPSHDSYGFFMCRNAAKTRLISAMDFVNRLKPEHLQAFWYFASKINFTLIGTFGSLLWATAPAQEEAEFYKTRLREYRWTLSVSSKRAEFLGYAVAMLDASRAMLSNLAEKPSVAAQQVSRTGVPSRSSLQQQQQNQQSMHYEFEQSSSPDTVQMHDSAGSGGEMAMRGSRDDDRGFAYGNDNGYARDDDESGGGAIDGR